MQEGELVLTQPLDGCSAYEGALFLRFCYCPDDMTEENLEAVESSLPTLLRLAHKLEHPGASCAVHDRCGGVPAMRFPVSMRWLGRNSCGVALQAPPVLAHAS